MAKPGEKYVGSSWYFRFRFRWQRTLERLTDAEAGRLVKAMLYYSMTGDELDLPGKESAAMSMLLDDLEEDREDAARISEKNRRNAFMRYARGGEAAPNGCDRMRSDATALKEGNKEVTKSPPIVPPRGRGRKKESSRYTDEDYADMERNEVKLE